MNSLWLRFATARRAGRRFTAGNVMIQITVSPQHYCRWVLSPLSVRRSPAHIHSSPVRITLPLDIVLVVGGRNNAVTCIRNRVSLLSYISLVGMVLPALRIPAWGTTVSRGFMLQVCPRRIDAAQPALLIPAGSMRRYPGIFTSADGGGRKRFRYPVSDVPVQSLQRLASTTGQIRFFESLVLSKGSSSCYKLRLYGENRDEVGKSYLDH